MMWRVIFAHGSLNMVKVRGGPITKEGKAISSQNAVKHGALTKKFQSSEEQEAYNHLLCSLQAEFQQSNPLVQMQLERIASLKIQLDRIQHHIDLTYANSQSESEKIEKVCEHLNISASEPSRTLYNRTENKRLAIFLKALEPAIHELLANPWNYFETTQEFLDQMPNFCAFLAFSADKKVEKINMLVNRLLSYFESIAMELSIKQSVSSYISSGKASDIRILDLIDPLEINAMISDAKIQNLKLLANELLEGYQKKKVDEYKHKAFQELMKNEVTPTGLRLDELDKLYRYQTAVQRQISTVMGELIHMHKTFIQSTQINMLKEIPKENN